MKHIKYITYGMCAMIVSSSCNKYLDTTSISNITVENFYTSTNDISQALTGVYNSLLSLPDENYYYLSELRTSNYYISSVSAARDYYTLSRFQQTADLSTAETSWSDLYTMIYRANKILESIDNVTYSDEDDKNLVIDQCRFLRAFAYFELVKNFGGVPLVTSVITSEEGYALTRTSADSIYSYIISELETVTTDAYLPYAYSSSSDLGRVTLNAAWAELGKVYLYYCGYPYYQTSYYEKALAAFQNVLDQESSSWTFASSYGDMFKYSNNNAYYLFEVCYSAGGTGLGSKIPGEVVPSSITYDWFPYGNYYITGNPSDDLIAAYEDGDTRKLLTLDTVYRNTSNVVKSGKWVKKYCDTTVVDQLTSSSDWPIDFPLIRSEDVMLMYAEVSNELYGPTTDAVTLVNRIRTRAGLDELTLSALTQDTFRDTIFHERRCEFGWEGVYWFDLVRSGNALTTMNTYLSAYYSSSSTTIQEYQLLLPIPTTEINAAPGIEQNPGY
ncbi:MAG: RagB/SusD family nutrient uptake outer membrane protein [Chitinophagaceae bacterium]